jgi:hypothetical protein
LDSELLQLKKIIEENGETQFLFAYYTGGLEEWVGIVMEKRIEMAQ